MLLRNGEQRIGLVLVSSILMTLLLLGAVSSGSTRSEYDILLDSTGANAGGQGDGYGGTWYYYSGPDEYVMWFYNQPYDASRIAPLEIWAYIEAKDPDKSCSVEISYGWSTPDWSSLGKNHPPLPADTGNTTQSSYIHTVSLYYEDYMNLGSSSSIEPHETERVSGNPEWICIIIRGKNIHVYRWINHDCVTDTGTPPDEEPGTELGAACNRQTGECFIAMSAPYPYVWLGAGTSCDDCTIDTTTMDFGDAPASYPVLLSSNGARHTVKPGIYLGTGASKDSDGKPSGTAASDDYDDGVVWTSTPMPGHIGTVQITASTNGVINAWIDWNRDGDWADAGEKILVDEPVRTGANTVSYSVPASASLGTTFARFRFSTSTGLNYTGLASDGEVEDYMVQVTSDGGGGGQNPGIYIPQSPSNGYYPKYSQPAKVVGQTIQGWPEVSLYTTGPILADDWSDQDQQPIIGIRWWGSFSNWVQSSPPTDVPSAFHVGVWTDAMGSGIPSILVWETTTTNWSWAFSGYAQDPRGLLSGTSIFEFNSMLNQDKWFYPTLAKGTRYWVSISAVYGSQTTQNTWGFLTRQRNSGSGAMRIQTVGSVIPGQPGQWPPSVGSVFTSGLAVTYPQSVSWDLSFELLSSKSGWGSGGSGGSSGLYGDANQDGQVNTDDMATMINLLLGGPVFK